MRQRLSRSDADKDNSGGVAAGGNKGEDMEQGKKLVDEAPSSPGDLTLKELMSAVVGKKFHRGRANKPRS